MSVKHNRITAAKIIKHERVILLPRPSDAELTPEAQRFRDRWERQVLRRHDLETAEQ